MDDEVDDTAVLAENVLGLGAVALSGRRRDRLGQRRTLRLTPRFTDGELAEIATAAADAGMTPNGFCAEVVLNVVHGLPVSYETAQEREVLARLQRELFAARTAVNRFGGNVNQAVARLHATGEAPADVSHMPLSCAGARCATLTYSSMGCIGACGDRARSLSGGLTQTSAPRSSHGSGPRQSGLVRMGTTSCRRTSPGTESARAVDAAEAVVLQRG